MNNFLAQLKRAAEFTPRWKKFYREVLYRNKCRQVSEDVTDKELQYSGIDRFVEYDNHRLSFDEKIREKDYNDFLLEHFSNLQTKRAGWAFDRTKRNDYIAYAILPSGKCYVLPAALLRQTCLDHYATIIAQSERIEAANDGYVTESYCIKRDILWELMLDTARFHNVSEEIIKWLERFKQPFDW